MKTARKEISLDHLFPKSSPTLGDGYQKSIHHFTANQGVEYPARKNPQELPQSITFVSIEYVSNLKDTMVTLMGDIKVSASTFASAEMGLSAESMDSHLMLYAVVIINQKLKEEYLSEKTLGAAAKESVKKKKINSFYHQFGNRYVTRITYGKKMIFILQLSAHDESTKVSLLSKIALKENFFEIKPMAEFLYKHLKEVKIINKNIYAIGVKAPFSDFDNIEQLSAKIQGHLESQEGGIIDYDTELYTTIPDFNDEDSKFCEEVQEIDELIEKILTRVIKLEKKFSKVINSIANMNPKVVNSDDLLSKDFMDLRGIVRSYMTRLQNIKDEIINVRKIYIIKTYEEYSKTIQTAEEWFDKNEEQLKIAGNHALIDRIELSEKNHDIEFSIPAVIRENTKYLFLKFENQNSPSFNIVTRKMKLLKSVVLKENIPSKGAYIRVDIEFFKHLSVTLSNDIYHGQLILNVYASSASKKLISQRGYNIIEIRSEFTQYIKKQAIKRQILDLDRVSNMRRMEKLEVMATMGMASLSMLPGVAATIAMAKMVREIAEMEKRGVTKEKPLTNLDKKKTNRQIHNQLVKLEIFGKNQKAQSYRLACSVNRSKYRKFVTPYIKNLELISHQVNKEKINPDKQEISEISSLSSYSAVQRRFAPYQEMQLRPDISYKQEKQVPLPEVSSSLQKGPQEKHIKQKTSDDSESNLINYKR